MSPLLPAQAQALEALDAGTPMLGLIPGAGKTRIAIEHARAIGTERDSRRRPGDRGDGRLAERGSPLAA